MKHPILWAALLAGCSSFPTFEFQGAAHYDGRTFMETDGQFKALALSPTGGHVAFWGQDDSSHNSLFVGEVDGKIRRVAGAGSETIAWAADGSSICYQDQVPGHGGISIQQLVLATGETRPVLYSVPTIPFFPSPDGASVLVGGQSLVDNPLMSTRRYQMVTAGKTVTVAEDVLPGYEGWTAVWSPDGQHVALAVAPQEGEGVPHTVEIAAAPDWKTSGSTSSSFSGRYMAMAWEDDRTLRVADVVVGDFLTLTRLDLDGKQLDVQQVPLDSPPYGTRYGYDRPSFATGARRLLLTRQPTDMQGGPSTARQHFVVDEATLRPLATSEDLAPVGWVDGQRFLFMRGFFQQQHPVVVGV